MFRSAYADVPPVELPIHEAVLGRAAEYGDTPALVDGTDGTTFTYARDRTVWNTPIGAHQAIAHPLAQAHIDLELARLMMQKAAHLYDAGDDVAAGEAANMAKYAAGEACVKAVDQAVHTLGGNGLTREFGLASLITAARVARIAPVSREMILNYVSHQTLGLPKSY